MGTLRCGAVGPTGGLGGARVKPDAASVRLVGRGVARVKPDAASMRAGNRQMILKRALVS